jgi:hypothetical protein
MRAWHEAWFEHYFRFAQLVNEDNPLKLGWCVYIEALDFE